MKIKTRFAPSPTGYLHVGSIRTALYSWLFARQHGGNFVLRIEDTDYERSTYKVIDSIIESMNWLRLDWDEGPYIQTDRLDRYHSVINQMLKIGTAYKCYCSKDRLKFLRNEQISRGEKPRYDRHCFRRYKHSCINDNKPYVVRFSNPQTGYVTFNDQIRGQIKFNNQELDDLIICRTDGSPTYNFCVVVDDWDMQITHVIRGEDHINNTPRQINLLKSLNAPIPIYAHVSMIYGSDGKKLSKRHNVMNVMQYRDEGFLPEALFNYLVRLGWSQTGSDKEIFSREEMIKRFSLQKISKSACLFDINKLLWLNRYYINVLPKEYVSKHLKWHITQECINICHGPQLSEIIELFGKRYKTLKDIAKNCHYLYEEFSELDINLVRKYLFSTVAYKILKKALNKFVIMNNWTKENISYTIQEIAGELDVQMNTVGMPLRIAVTGIQQSPPLYQIIHAIGKNRVIARISRSLDFILKYKDNKKENYL